MPITFRLSSYKSHWLVGENVQIDLIFENRSRKLVHVPDIENPRNWQPILSLTGPGYARPFHFNVGIGRLQPGPADQTYRALSLTGIKPGQTYERSPYLGKSVNLSRPGTYTLSASTQTSLGTVQAAPFLFTVGAPTRASTGALEMQAGLPDHVHFRTRWMVSGAQKTQVMRAPLNSRDDDAGAPHFEQGTPLAIATVGGDAREPFAPWTDRTAAGDEPDANWTGWRDAAFLYATQGLDNAEYPKLQLLAYPLLLLPLPGGARLIPHALLSVSQALDVFTLSADGRTLQMARFPTAVPQIGQPAVVHPAWAWSRPIPAPAQEAAAVQAPIHAASARHVVWTAQEGDALLVGHVLAPANGQAPADAPPVTLPGAHALPGCRPAVRVDPDGLAHVAILYAADASPRQIMLAELTYGASGGPAGAPVVTAQGALPAAASSAVVAYGKDRWGTFRHDWLVVLGDSRVMFRLGGRAPHGPMDLGTTLAAPLELAPLPEGTFVLTLDPKMGAGPSLTRLRE